MLYLKGELVRLIKWDLRSESKWGKMQFETDNIVFQDVTTSMLTVRTASGKNLITVEGYILNNISPDVLYDASLLSICESVLSGIDEDAIKVISGNRAMQNQRYTNRVTYDEPVVNNDFGDMYDDYEDDDISIGVDIEDVDDDYEEVEYYDDMDSFDEYDDDDDDF